MDFAERYLYLRSMPGGPKFTETALLPLAESAEEVVFRRGVRLLAVDTLPESVFFLMEGQVELVERDGKSRGFIGAPGAVGILALMGDCEMPYDVIAREEVVALSVDTDFFRETFEDNFDVALEIMSSLAANLAARRTQLPAGLQPPLTFPAHLARARELGLVERMLIIRRFDIFGPGALTGLTEVAQHFVEETYEAGDVLYRSGDHADMFYLLLSGSLRVEWPESVQMEGIGSPYGNLEALGSLPRGATATVVERVRLLRVPFETLVDVFEDHTDMMLAIIAQLARLVMLFTGTVFNPDVVRSSAEIPAPPAASTQIPPPDPAPPPLMTSDPK